MVEAALIPGLVGALGLAGAGTAAKGTMDMMNSGKGKTGVLGDGLMDSPMKSKKAFKIPEELQRKIPAEVLKELSPEKIKEMAAVLGIPMDEAPERKKIMPRKMSGMDKLEVLLLLSEGGIPTNELIGVEDNGYIPTKGQFARVPEHIQKKLAKLTGLEVEQLMAGIGGNPKKDDDGETEEEERERKTEETKKKVQREIDRAKNYDKEETKFRNNNPKGRAKANLNRWGKTEFETIEKPGKPANTPKYNEIEHLNKNNPKMKNLSPRERMDLIRRQHENAIKNGREGEWIFNNVKPLS